MKNRNRKNEKLVNEELKRCEDFSHVLSLSDDELVITSVEASEKKSIGWNVRRKGGDSFGGNIDLICENLRLVAKLKNLKIPDNCFEHYSELCTWAVAYFIMKYASEQKS